MNIVTKNWGYTGNSAQALLATYIGKNADKYLLVQEMLHNYPTKIYWNWAAAALGPVWLFYRKLYSWLFIWLLIGVPFDFVYFSTPVLDPALTNPLLVAAQRNYALLSILYIVATNILLGCWGSHLFLQQSERVVKRFESKVPFSIAAALLAEKANPSYWRLVSGIFLIVGIYGLTFLAAYFTVN